jgi:ankyrin repeat protein
MIEAGAMAALLFILFLLSIGLLFYACVNQALSSAIEKQNTNMIVKAIRRGATVNGTDKHGCTALMWAAWDGNACLTNDLLSRGAGIDLADIYGRTPLMLAAQDGQVETVKILITSGSNVNAQDVSGQSALILAAGFRQVEIVKRLLGSGAMVNAQTVSGETALMRAAICGFVDDLTVSRPPTRNYGDPLQADIVNELLACGANPNITNSTEKTAAVLAFDTNHRSIALVLRAAMIKGRSTSSGPKASLHRPYSRVWRQSPSISPNVSVQLGCQGEE